MKFFGVDFSWRRVRPDGPSMATLAALIADFERNALEELRSELEHHRAQPDERAALRAAASWRGASGRFHPGQWRMPRAVKRAAGEALCRVRFDFGGMDRFETLFAAVHEAIGGVRGVGEVCVYDAALRIGVWRGLLPSRVRLHGTSRESAVALGVEADRRPWIEVEAFPSELAGLRSWEIERFLSRYRDELEALTRRRLGASLRRVVASHVLKRSAASAA